LAESPFDASIRAVDAGDVLADPLFKNRLPRDELEAASALSTARLQIRDRILPFVQILRRIGDPDSRLDGMEIATPQFLLTSEPTETRKFLRDDKLRSGTPRPETAR
jgi:hypothetical protein